jgi:cyclase
MLKTRVIPTMLWKDLTLVKGVGFDSWRRVATILPTLKVYNTRQVDELAIMDITATDDEREPDYDEIAEFAQECFVPLTFGGGVRNIETIQKLLQVGADKVSINSAAYANPDLITQASNIYGVQCIIVSIDVKQHDDGSYECYSNSGKTPTGHHPVEWAKEMAKRGAGELLVTSIDRDGTMDGYDVNLIQSIANAVNIPVIASGGAGNYDHMHDVLTNGNASAVAAASIFHFTEQTPMEAKMFLAEKGLAVRNYHIFNKDT